MKRGQCSFIVLSWYPLPSATSIEASPLYQTHSVSPINVRECRNHPKTITTLLEGNETRRVRGTDTGTAVLDGLAERGVSIHVMILGPAQMTYYEIENSAR